TTCTYNDISARQPRGSGLHPSALVETVNGKLLVVTEDGANLSKPALFQCNLDGTGCTYADISAGEGAKSGLNPSAVLDPSNSRLLVVTDNLANSSKPALFSVCVQ